MWPSLTSLKISIAGARLSHLVQKDRIWDHGSMVEQVKAIFFQMEKAKNRNDVSLVKKYLTVAGNGIVNKQLTEMQAVPLDQRMKNAELLEVNIISVLPGSQSRPDQFKALLRGEKAFKNESSQSLQKKSFRELWVMVRQGDWWLLDEIKH